MARTKSRSASRQNTRRNPAELEGVSTGPGPAPLVIPRLGTERQRRRRTTILSVARELVAERGYEGLTIRDLAQRAGVAPQTLYDNYKNKDNLLALALEEHLAPTTKAITEASLEHEGIERLFYVVGAGCEGTVHNASLMKALGGLIPASPELYMYHGVHLQIFRDSVRYVAKAGGFSANVDIELWINRVCLQIISILFFWARDIVPNRELKDQVLLAVSCALLFPSRGRTRLGLVHMIEQCEANLARRRASPHTKQVD
jgi:AcrR family transcriptional regulator